MAEPIATVSRRPSHPLPPPPADLPVILNPAATREAQLFLDPSDPSCRAAIDAIEALDRAEPGRVRFVWRFAPSDDGSEEVAGWAIALAEANRQGGAATLWRLHQSLCAHHDALDLPSLSKLAAAAGVDEAKLNAALHDRRFAADFARDQKVMIDAGVIRNSIVLSERGDGELSQER